MNGRPFTAAEAVRTIDLLEEGYALSTIARRLGRTTKSVAIWCQLRGGVRQYRPFTAQRVAQLLGVCQTTVPGWIARGWLPARRVGRGSGSILYVIESAVLAFLEEPRYWPFWAAEGITQPRWREWAIELRQQLGPWLAVSEAAHRIGYTGTSVRAAIARGDLPAERLGGQWFVDRVAVEQFVPPALRPRRRRRVTFTPAEDAELLALFGQRQTYTAIGRRLGRTRGSVTRRLQALRDSPSERRLAS